MTPGCATKTQLKSFFKQRRLVRYCHKINIYVDWYTDGLRKKITLKSLVNSFPCFETFYIFLFLQTTVNPLHDQGTPTTILGKFKHNWLFHHVHLVQVQCLPWLSIHMQVFSWLCLFKWDQSMEINENEKVEASKNNAIDTHHVRYCILDSFTNILEQMKRVNAAVLL